jgi:uncharacterized protein (TIGR03118 family)
MLRRTLHQRRWRVTVAVMGITALAMAAPALASAASSYRQTNLVSDIPGKAMLTDSNLVNPWGLAAGPSKPLWVADNGMNVSTIYPGAVGGMPISIAPLVVSIPQGAPTGTVFNPTQAFKVWNGSAWVPSLFLFDSEAGVVSGWPGSGTMAITARTVKGAVFKGLTMARAEGRGPLLYAADFTGGEVVVFNGRFQRVHVPGGFTDPNLPSGYGPFGIQAIGRTVYVTFAKQAPMSADEVHGPGLGFVDAFTPTGRLIMRVASHGGLNAPWGLARAPDGFGRFSHALLVGNFGDGRIDAYSTSTGRFLGALRRPTGKTISIDGLWGLRFGNGVTGSPRTLLFSAGLNGEADGLLGAIRAAR